jgi:hypothetical protein
MYLIILNVFFLIVLFFFFFFFFSIISFSGTPADHRTDGLNFAVVASVVGM